MGRAQAGPALYLLAAIASQYLQIDEFGEISVSSAQAQTEKTSIETPQVAVTTAKNAFEYRDFKKVILVLGPWVHPPRIADSALMGEARRLLGVSHHITGNLEQAKEEFAQLLLIQPNTKLDPFVIPPAVIQTFENVRKAVVSPPKDKPKGPTQIVTKTVIRIDSSVNLLPLGYAQLFVHENQVAWGVTWLAVQTLGIALNLGGFWGASNLNNAQGIPIDKKADFDSLVTTMYAGAGIWAVGYLGSVVQGYAGQARRERDLAPQTLAPLSEDTHLIQVSLPFP